MNHIRTSGRDQGVHQRTTLTVVLACLAGISLVATAVPANASTISSTESSTLSVASATPNSGGEKVAALVSAVAPDQGQVIRSEIAGAVSANPSDVIVVPGGNSSNLGIKLPPEAVVNAGTATSDGTVVFKSAQAGTTDVAVQAMDTGGVRIQTIINDPSSSHEFTYSLEAGFKVQQASDGSIWAVGFTTAGEFQAYSVAAAWAHDANGAEVATHYEVRAGSLVQIVTPNESTVYPVVADPTWQWYSFAYGAGFSKAETSTLASAGGVAGFCVLVPPGPFQIACGVAGADWFFQAGLAANAGGCVFIAAVPAPLAMRWSSPECR